MRKIKKQQEIQKLRCVSSSHFPVDAVFSVKGPRTGNTERWHSDEIFSKIRQMFIFLCWIRICNQIFQIRFQSPATGHWRSENNKMTFSEKSMQTWFSMF